MLSKMSMIFFLSSAINYKAIEGASLNIYGVYMTIV